MCDRTKRLIDIPVYHPPVVVVEPAKAQTSSRSTGSSSGSGSANNSARFGKSDIQTSSRSVASSTGSGSTSSSARLGKLEIPAISVDMLDAESVRQRGMDEMLGFDGPVNAEHLSGKEDNSSAVYRIHFEPSTVVISVQNAGEYMCVRFQTLVFSNCF